MLKFDGAYGAVSVRSESMTRVRENAKEIYFDRKEFQEWI